MRHVAAASEFISLFMQLSIIMRSRHKIIATVLVLLFVTACARDHARTARADFDGKRTNGAIVLENIVKQYREKTSSIKALAWVLLGSDEEERQTDAALVIMRPDHIRADAMDPLADVWARAGTDGKTMWLYLPSKSKLYSGRASTANLNRLTKFDFELSELLNILMGSPPTLGDAGYLQSARDRNHFVVEGTNIHIWTDGKRVIKVVRFGADDSQVEYTVEFGDFRRVQNIDFPFRVEALIPGRGARIVVVYKDVDFAGAADPSLFSLPDLNRAKMHKLDR